MKKLKNSKLWAVLQINITTDKNHTPILALANCASHQDKTALLCPLVGDRCRSPTEMWKNN